MKSEPLERVIPSSLSLLLLNEDGTWVVQCLEYDIATQGSTPKEAFDDFWRAFIGQIAAYVSIGEDPFERIRPAPEFYWKRLRECRSIDLDEIDSGIIPELSVDARSWSNVKG